MPFVLLVDPEAHAVELRRFWRYVVAGPGASCAIWTGSISDDGYGRFWLKRDGVERAVRPHRYAYAAVHGVALSPIDVVMHDCDEPICCRAETGPGGHLRLGTQAENLATMGRRGRGGGDWRSWRWRGTDRASVTARSRALREAVKDGWDAARVAAALAGSITTEPLFDLPSPVAELPRSASGQEVGADPTVPNQFGS